MTEWAKRHEKQVGLFAIGAEKLQEAEVDQFHGQANRPGARP